MCMYIYIYTLQFAPFVVAPRRHEKVSPAWRRGTEKGGVAKTRRIYIYIYIDIHIYIYIYIKKKKKTKSNNNDIKIVDTEE